MSTETARKNPIDKPRVLVATSLVSGVGALLFAIMPVFAAAIADQFNYGEEQVGDLVAAFFPGYTLIGVSSMFWILNFNWRVISLIGLALGVSGIGAMAFLTGYTALTIAMVIGGIGMGTLYALATAIIGEASDPDRGFGIKLGLETAPGAILILILSAYVVGAFGFKGVVFVFVGVSLLLGASGYFLPVSGPKGHHGPDGASRTDEKLELSGWLLPFIGLLAGFFYFSGLAGGWGFLEIIGDTKGLSAGGVGNVLFLGMFSTIAGGLFAAWLGDRFGRVIPLAGAIGLYVVGILLIRSSTNIWIFGIGSISFLITLNFALAFVFGLTASVDVSGRLIVLSAAALSSGAVVGPALAGRLIEARGYETMLAFVALSGLLCLGLHILLVHLSKDITN